MPDTFSRMEILLGKKGTDALARARVAVFGLGGAGSYVVESLARCGIGSLTLVDSGILQRAHMNRHLYALPSTLGMSKVEAAKEHVHQIDSQILVRTYETFFSEDTMNMFDFRQFQYVVDVTDTVSAKLLMIQKAKEARVPVISCLELGNRLDGEKLTVTELSRAHTPMAKMMQMELKQRKIDQVRVLCSREKPSLHPEGGLRTLVRLRKKGEQEAVLPPSPTGSVSYIYGIAGARIADEVVRDLLRQDQKKS